MKVFRFLLTLALLCSLLVAEEVPKEVKVAFITSQKRLGKNILSVTKTALAYAMFSGCNIKFDFYTVSSETSEQLSSLLKEIKDKNTSFAISFVPSSKLLNTTGAKQLSFFFPIEQKPSNIETNSSFAVFGEFDYGEQMMMLREFADNDEIVYFFSDPSEMSTRLSDMAYTAFGEMAQGYMIKKNSLNLKALAELMQDDPNFVLLLNTPPVKSVAVLSQLNSLGIKPKKILSTQLNIDPLLYSFINERYPSLFRGISGLKMEESMFLFANNTLSGDIRYNSLAYSTAASLQIIAARQGCAERFLDINETDGLILYHNSVIAK